MFHKMTILLLLGLHILIGKIILYETVFINRLTGIFDRITRKDKYSKLSGKHRSSYKETAILLSMTFG
jgi:hypothetical protein